MVDAQNEAGNYDAGKYLAKTYKDKGMTGTQGKSPSALPAAMVLPAMPVLRKPWRKKGVELKDIKEAITYTRDEA